MPETPINSRLSEAPPAQPPSTPTTGLVQLSKYFNYEIEQAYSDGDNDQYITLLETYALQGKDGFILSPDTNVFDRVVEVADELEVPYLLILTPHRDDDGKQFGSVRCGRLPN